MSPPLSMEYAGVVYHVTSRGDQRGSIFLTEQVGMGFLETLGRVAELYGWRVHAWCQMTNHYHLLVDAGTEFVPRMQQLNGHYAAHFNRANGRVGHVFQGRYKAICIERESYLLEVARYVVLNPVRAELVRAAADWSGIVYRDTAGHRSSPAWLTTETILGQFAEERRAAVSAYRAFVAAGKGQPSPWSGLRNEIYLGSEKIRPGFAGAYG